MMDSSASSTIPALSKSAEPFCAGARVRVVLALPVGAGYDYRVAAGMTLSVGDFVRVPLGKRHLVGVVWGAGTGDVAEERMKDVAAVMPTPAMPDEQRRFLEWVAAYTLSPLGAVLKMALSVPEALEPPRESLVYALNAQNLWPDTPRLSPARRRIIALLGDAPAMSAADISREAGCSASVLRGLVQAGVVCGYAAPVPERTFAVPDPDRPAPALNPDQRRGADVLAERAAGDAFCVVVVDGVTGSGKTEVYFEAIAAALRRGRQVLVLLPEIALGAQWLRRFEARFAAAPAQWHSDLTAAQRRETWRAVADGRARVVVGARSALFLPFRDLGLIVVDEEHDGAFKQDEGVIYHARDMAVVRGRIGGFLVVPVSATPSLETLVNIEAGRYERIALPTRHGDALLPDVGLIDMRKERPGAEKWISTELCDAVARTLAAGEQVLLFLNRRGYAPLTLCRTCGHRMQCPGCSAWLVEHRGHKRLLCHHCGFSVARPARCPACDDEDAMVACGPGVERLAEEARETFPDARIVLASSDTLTGPRAALDLVRRIENHEVDIIVGTQVVAKGYHFALLTLVGVIDGDVGLMGGDLRAGERTYQLLSQVSGRAGRAARVGRVLMQTYLPDHPVMTALASGDREAFLSAEKDGRRATHMPPYGRLVALIVSGRDARTVDAMAQRLARSAPSGEAIQVLGPAPAPMALLRGRHRRRLLLKARKDVRVQGVVAAWLRSVPAMAGVRVQVDVDPMNFF